MEFSRQEYWSGLPFPSPGDLPNPGIKPGSPTLQADSSLSEPPGKPLQGQTCLLFKVSLDFLLLPSNPLWWKGHHFSFSFLVLVLESLIDLHRTGQLQIFSISDWGIDLNLEFSIYSDVEWLPWKWTKIILLFLRLHPGTEFWTLLLTLGATPFLLRDSCPQ